MVDGAGAGRPRNCVFSPFCKPIKKKGSLLHTALFGSRPNIERTIEATIRQLVGVAQHAEVRKSLIGVWEGRCIGECAIEWDFGRQDRLRLTGHRKGRKEAFVALTAREWID